MDLVPLRAAAGGGSINGLEATRLVAAGFTLLQRCVPLVRALSGRRSAILLPSSPQFLVALAASDGRGALLIDPSTSAAEVERRVRDANVGAVFTTAELQWQIPSSTPRVLLDQAPVAAIYTVPGGDEQIVELGSHFGLDLEFVVDDKKIGEAAGRLEECAIAFTGTAEHPHVAVLTHRAVLTNALNAAEVVGAVAADHVLAMISFAHPFGLTVALTAPLLVGARVTTMPRVTKTPRAPTAPHFDPLKALTLVEREGITQIVGTADDFVALLAAIAQRGTPFRPTGLRVCLCAHDGLTLGLQDQWADATGTELRAVAESAR